MRISADKTSALVLTLGVTFGALAGCSDGDEGSVEEFCAAGGYQIFEGAAQGRDISTGDAVSEVYAEIAATGRGITAPSAIAEDWDTILTMTENMSRNLVGVSLDDEDAFYEATRLRSTEESKNAQRNVDAFMEENCTSD